MSNLVAHFERELRQLDNGVDFNNSLIHIAEIFSGMGHSGGSAEMAIVYLERLLRFRNLTPLTDDPDEWICHSEEVSGVSGGVWQNIRNSEAFSNNGGKTYYLLSEGGRFMNPDNKYHTSTPIQIGMNEGCIDEKDSSSLL